MNRPPTPAGVTQPAPDTTPGGATAYQNSLRWQGGYGTPTTEAQNQWDWDQANRSTSGEGLRSRMTNAEASPRPRPIDEGLTKFDYAMNALMGAGGYGGGGGHVPGVVSDDTSGDDAAWARAKDRTAGQTRGAVKSLQSYLADRGITGGGVEGQLTTDVLRSGGQQIADVTREQAIQEQARRQSVSDRNYQGAITQRGQDITAQGQRWSLMPSILSLLRAGVSY